MSKAQKKMIKSIIKARVPKDKRKEILGAVDKLDLDVLMGMLRDPQTFSDMMNNPARLNDFVVPDEDEVVDASDCPAIEDNGEDALDFAYEGQG